MRLIFVVVVCGLLMSSEGARAADAMNAVAERYVHLEEKKGVRANYRHSSAEEHFRLALQTTDEHTGDS